MRCPVRLVEKYINLCPMASPKMKKFNFYLRSLERPTFNQWYGGGKQCIRKHTLSKTVKELLKIAKLEGFFTNHSLRHSGTTRLFQQGVNKKLVKEFMGHVSDAVDQYQVTSDKQHEEMSNIIQGNNVEQNTKETELQVRVNQKGDGKCMG